MKLIYFTDEAYNLLKKDLYKNEKNYYLEELWIEKYFKEYNIENYMGTSDIVVGNISEFQDTGDINQDDLQNTITLYSAYLDKLTPAEASNPRLWTALCHLIPEYRKYILSRWKNKNEEVTLEKRFFATEGRSSLLYYNAISRLWWSGYLTYEQDKAQPWALTKTLFSAQMVQKDLLDQPFSFNKKVVRGLLKALQKIQEQTGNAASKIFRECCDSYINHYGAVTVLDSLSEDEIENIAYKYMFDAFVK